MSTIKICRCDNHVFNTTCDIHKSQSDLGLDYSKIDDIEVDGIDGRDAPDFCDAYISSASYDGRDMTDDELDQLNSDGDFVHEQVIAWIY